MPIVSLYVPGLPSLLTPTVLYTIILKLNTILDLDPLPLRDISTYFVLR